MSAHLSLWSHTDSTVYSLLNSFVTTAESMIISRLQIDHTDHTDDSNQAALEAQVVDWFQQYLSTLSGTQLCILLRFITSSNVLNGPISITFSGSQNENSMIQVATCGRQIRFSWYIVSYRALETLLLNIINNPNFWNIFDTL